MNRSYLLAAAIALAACADKKPATPPPPAVKGIASLGGTWTVKLSEKQERELRNMNLMFQAEEPSKEILDSLTPEERTTLMAIRTARLKSPDDPQYLKMKSVVESMRGTRLWIGTSSLTLTIGQVREDAPFVVQTDTATAVVVRAKMSDGREQPVQLSIDGPDEIRMSRPGQRESLSFVRSPK